MDFDVRQRGILHDRRNEPYKTIGMLTTGDGASLAGILFPGLAALALLLPASDSPKMLYGLGQPLLNVKQSSSSSVLKLACAGEQQKMRRAFASRLLCVSPPSRNTADQPPLLCCYDPTWLLQHSWFPSPGMDRGRCRRRKKTCGRDVPPARWDRARDVPALKPRLRPSRFAETISCDGRRGSR